MTFSRHIPLPGDTELTNITELLTESSSFKKRALVSLRKLRPSTAVLNKFMVTALSEVNINIPYVNIHTTDQAQCSAKEQYTFLKRLINYKPLKSRVTYPTF
jgi:hypothetical protein